MGTKKGVRTPTDANLQVLRALLSGKYLKFSMSMKSRKMFQVDTGLQNPDVHMKKLEEMGIVKGYIPVLSEAGSKVLNTMEAFYASNGKKPGESKEPLVEVMGKKVADG